jgi:excisionase family DNA binding protein
VLVTGMSRAAVHRWIKIFAGIAGVLQSAATQPTQSGEHMNQMMKYETGPKFLNVQEAAAFLRVSSRTVFGWVSQRAIPHRKAGRRLLFLESELLEWTKPNLRPTQHRTLAS